MTAQTICYGRVSTDDQAVNGHSLDSQRTRLEAYCVTYGYAPVLWLADQGVSGGVAPAERPALAEALALLESGDAERLVCTNIDRLGRRSLDVLELVARADAGGWSLAAVDQHLDTDTPWGRFTLQILAAVAELEREMIRKRTRDGMAAARAKGVHVGRPVSPLTLAAGRRVHQLRAEGVTYGDVCLALTDEGYLTADGHQRWSHAQARRAEQAASRADDAG